MCTIDGMTFRGPPYSIYDLRFDNLQLLGNKIESSVKFHSKLRYITARLVCVRQVHRTHSSPENRYRH